ncbi:type I polyketide synthase [Streptomyces sp. NPDC091292]|uniref:type I polyketide synthase n=1 Tax=Streptomyces sp. NPDC091292 TaxID=3365991 RepID=UPI0037F17919
MTEPPQHDAPQYETPQHETPQHDAPQHDDASIAVIGMAGRFPGAADLDAFWRNTAAGTDTITRRGTTPGGHPSAYGIVEDADLFDAEFFGYAPSEALMLDPQHRVFLECVWQALEHAGCDPGAYPGLIGVYAGSGDTDHLALLRTHRDLFPGATDWQFRLATGMDFLTSRVAYKLGLKGPAVTVQTACSTSLVAVHQACQALLAGECDTAVAGGVTIRIPHPSDDPGEDGVLSPDGYCRSFDADANGTVSSDGAGVVVLKRLADARADHDRVHAVILGSAVNNDGAGKVGFTAPGVAGQAAAVRTAHLAAGVDPATIAYVEAHGTATEIGDPIEVRALTRAFALGTDRRGFCVLGSVKSAIGHTDAAAGVIGLIKVVLALRHELIPGTAHFRRVNPGMDLDGGPFVVRAEATAWPRRTSPRRAGVNSLGIGGTNAHVVVEEPPVPEPPVLEPPVPEPSASADAHPHPYHLLPLSARSAEALGETASRLAAHLRDAEEPLADISWTLQTGRKAFAHRGFVVCGGVEEAGRGLTAGRVGVGEAPDGARRTAFLFPGQGGQHVGMARELYAADPVFRTAVDRCAELAAPELGLDLRDVLYPVPGDDGRAERWLDSMRVCQPVLFAVQHALAEVWRSRGVGPSAVVGHSLGAYAAAHTAGVLSLPDAMTLVLARGRLLDGLPSGAMLAVELPESALVPMLGGRMSLAAVNGPSQCVVTGPSDAVRRLKDLLAARGVDVRELRISAAAHSSYVESVIAEYTAVVRTVRLRPPVIPWISDRTGTFVTADEACDPAYWAAHLRHTVRFSDALGTLLASGDEALLELGPGRTLGDLARRHPDCAPGRPVVHSLPHAVEAAGGARELLTATGRLWQAGVPVDWAALHGDGRPRRVPLPSYPFRRRRFRLGDTVGAVGPEGGEAARESGSARPGDAGDAGDLDTDAGKAVAGAFRAVLGLATVDPRDDFFELGGDSLMASRVMAMLRPRFGADLTVRALFRAPTVAALAAYVEEHLAVHVEAEHEAEHEEQDEEQDKEQDEERERS